MGEGGIYLSQPFLRRLLPPGQSSVRLSGPKSKLAPQSLRLDRPKIALDDQNSSSDCQILLPPPSVAKEESVRRKGWGGAREL